MNSPCPSIAHQMVLKPPSCEPKPLAVPPYAHIPSGGGTRGLVKAYLRASVAVNAVAGVAAQWYVAFKVSVLVVSSLGYIRTVPSQMPATTPGSIPNSTQSSDSSTSTVITTFTALPSVYHANPSSIVQPLSVGLVFPGTRIRPRYAHSVTRKRSFVSKKRAPRLPWYLHSLCACLLLAGLLLRILIHRTDTPCIRVCVAPFAVVVLAGLAASNNLHEPWS